MAGQFRNEQGSGEPARQLFLITPSDVDLLPFTTRAIWVGGAGDIALMTDTGSIGILPSAVAGTIIPIVAAKIFSTNTTATKLWGMY